MPTISPWLRYDDARAAIDFLCEAFGFERVAVYDGENGSVMHAELRLGDGYVMLGSGASGGAGKGPQEAAFGVSVTVDDPDAHHERARAAGAEISYPPRDTAYGAREYGARDPGGYAWSFGTYEPGSQPN